MSKIDDNVAPGKRTTLTRCYHMMRDPLRGRFPHLLRHPPHNQGFRAGDASTHCVEDGSREAMDWYVQHLAATP